MRTKIYDTPKEQTANTIGFYEGSRGTNITSAGSGTGHTLTPQYDYTNSIVIGVNQDPSASNQVILGNSSITQTLLRGNVQIDSSLIGGALIDGDDTFDATQTSDTVLITGAATTDHYAVTWCGATVPSAPLAKESRVGSLLVHCAVADTAIARASGYDWIRIR
jgi:hypothetical protein